MQHAETDSSQAPHPGVPEMPRWNLGPLVDAPEFTWRNWAAMIGPGMVMGAASIGGGEWLTGPLITARYGGSLFWLATLSIVGQVIYNLEISRYALYSGEPIFTGKFRLFPGPMVWVWVYLAVDFGSVFPYLASNAATPAAMCILGRMPDLNVTSEWWLLKGLGYAIFLLAMVPLIFGGKVYNSLKVVTVFKLAAVMGFLLFLAVFYSDFETWHEIFTGFFKFGNVPVTGGDGNQVQNVFAEVISGRGFPSVELSILGILSALVAISGSGGLTNSAISNYTRDQGWGMGYHVGAIPSVVGGQHLKLSHVGMVFEVTPETLPRWRRWCRHIVRDQLVIWMPACFVGLALPSMLSVQFLERGLKVESWTAAGMTAGGVAKAVGPSWGPTFWYLTLGCGFLILATSMVTTADGILRRWVDVFWTSLPALRRWDPHDIRKLFFRVLCGYVVFGLVMLSLNKPDQLLVWAGNFYNLALGVSCWHTLAVNTILLPPPLRPGWGLRIGLVLSGLFFFLVFIIATTATIMKT